MDDLTALRAALEHQGWRVVKRRKHYQAFPPDRGGATLFDPVVAVGLPVVPERGGETAAGRVLVAAAGPAEGA